MAETLSHRYARTGQCAIVYFISDHDPSGRDLQRAWEEALANFRVRVSEFVRIGLTREEVDDLDSARLREGIAVKPSDSRAKRYIEQYGERCWALWASRRALVQWRRALSAKVGAVGSDPGLTTR